MEILRQSSATRENLGMLAVMEALEEQKQITQRELAIETGLNLKKVNYCLHKLMEKGYIKFHRARKNPDKRAYLYVLTPPGLRAKSQLTYDFLKFTLNFYNKVEHKLQDCLLDMGQSGVKRVLLWGASDVVRILVGQTNEVDVIGVVDDTYANQECYGVPVFKSNQVHKLVFEGILITTLDGLSEVETQLNDLNVDSEIVWRLS